VGGADHIELWSVEMVVNVIQEFGDLALECLTPVASEVGCADPRAFDDALPKSGAARPYGSP
jgi:hypothetical protein